MSAIGGVYGALWREHSKTKEVVRKAVRPMSSPVDDVGSGSNASSGGPLRGDESGAPSSFSMGQWIGLFMGPLLFALIVIFFRPEGLGFGGVAVMGAALWMAAWWISECIPLPITALIPIVVFPLTGATDTSEVFSAYGDNIIFLFMGGFAIAVALEKWGLHKRIALGIVAAVGVSVQRIILGFILATAFVSLWITNTATAMMMIPIGTAIIAQVRALAVKEGADQQDVKKFEKSMIFGIGYGATIAGVGTLVGGTSSPVFVAQVDALLGIQISFAQYALFGIPFVLVFLLCLWVYLTQIMYRTKLKHIPGGREVIDRERKALGRMSREEKLVAFAGLLVAFLWVTRAWFIEPYVISISDGMIAAFGALLLFVLPAKNKSQSARILVWEDSAKIPWGILLLFGGGLALATGFTSTGLSDWVGEQFMLLGGLPFVLILIVSVLALVFLTEFTSTTATALLFIPLMGTVAVAIDQDPVILMLATALAVNCAFMLPASTPPNAIIYGSGMVSIRELATTGLAVSMFGVILISLFVMFWAPVVFNR